MQDAVHNRDKTGPLAEYSTLTRNNPRSLLPWQFRAALAPPYPAHQNASFGGPGRCAGPSVPPGARNAPWRDTGIVFTAGIEEGRRWMANTRRPPFSGGLCEMRSCARSPRVEQTRRLFYTRLWCVTLAEGTATRKARGAFFTPGKLCRYVADWAIRAAGDNVLEPSCGEAAFLLAAGERLDMLAQATGVPAAASMASRCTRAAHGRPRGRPGRRLRCAGPGRRLLPRDPDGNVRRRSRQPTVHPLSGLLRRGPGSAAKLRCAPECR